MLPEMTSIETPLIPTLQARKLGLIPARIGSTIEFKLPRPMRFPSGRSLKAGERVHADVEDVTKFEGEPGVEITWHCRAITQGQAKSAWQSCEWQMQHAPKGFPTKAALLKAHPDNATLRANGECHLVFALADVSAREATEDKLDGKGNLVSVGTPARQARIVPVSDAG